MKVSKVKIDPCIVCHIFLDDADTCYGLNYKIKGVTDYYNYTDKVKHLALEVSTHYFQHQHYMVNVTYHILSFNTMGVVIDSKVGQFYNLDSHNNLKKEINKHINLVKDYIFEVSE